ncbi:MAG TPA: hypothetical protein VF347_00810, partial [Candidatus Humimicrobiaceae bacterium]
VVSGEIEITATGKFVGNLVQKDAQLTVAKGGLFKGQIIISENQDIFNITADKPFIRPAQNNPQTQTHPPTYTTPDKSEYSNKNSG